MSASHRRGLAVALALGSVAFACALLAHDTDLTLALAYLSPAVFVFVLLFVGRYPGERLLLACTRPRRRERVARGVKAPRLAVAQVPRGGNLLASALAGRAPPSGGRIDTGFSTA